ncbi:glycoside hydrolase family 3 protein [Gongronella butleri]|nr:glycoside hydrolase family 3 protein [Gongronella butleri]
MKILYAIAAAWLATASAKKPFPNAVYQNPDAPVEARVEDLLKRMTLEEKQYQLMQNNMIEVDYGMLKNGTLPPYGAFFADMMPRDPLAALVNATQDYFLHNTRLGIPSLMTSEGIHGYLDPNSTIFPAPLAMACSFNPDLLQQVGNVIGTEAESVGCQNILAPVLDLSRELRWGRVEENYGEDPHLTGEMGTAFVKGLQGTPKKGTAKTAKHRVASMVKHFVAHGSSMGGLNSAPVEGGERYLRSLYLLPFKKAILEGGAMSVMSAYHAYDGVPCTANHHTLTDILRGEWGFQGFVESDMRAVDQLCSLHYTCDPSFNDPAAAVMALNAGVDVEMVSDPMHFANIEDQVKKGNLDIKVVDEAVRRLLRAKFLLGMFENPWVSNDYNTTIHAPAHVALSQQVDEESMVLLENDGVLPLAKDTKIAVIGPQANVMQYGDYIYPGGFDRGVTPLAGLQAKVGNSKIIYEQGCELWSNDQSGFDDAVAAAKKADVALVMVGTWTRDQTLLWNGANATTGEHVDVNDLGLVGAQLDLVKAIQNTGVPTVVIYISGKPIAEPWIKNHANAVLQVFYPGEMGGHALANILYGDANPSGKLSVSFPTYVGSLPVYYNFLNGGRATDAGMITENGTMVFGHQYALGTPNALWYFGHGLSYTTFNYTGLSAANATVSAKEVNVSVTVKNTGKRDGKEVVQVYIRDYISSVVTPFQALKGFTKVHLKAGESKRVTVPIKVEELAVWTVNNGYKVEPGQFIAYVGGGFSETTLQTSFWLH